MRSPCLSQQIYLGIIGDDKPPDARKLRFIDMSRPQISRYLRT